MTGPQRILDAPFVFQSFLSLLGSRDAKRRLIEDYVRPEPGARILDLGCGMAPLLEFMPPSCEYLGFDLSPRYVKAARHRYGSRGTFVCQDIRGELGDIGRFDRVIAAGLLHHLDDAGADRLFAIARRHLAPRGTMTTFDATRVDGQAFVARWLMDMDRGDYIRRPEAYAALARQTFEHVETHVRTGLVRVPYTHCILQCAAGTSQSTIDQSRASGVGETT